MWIKTLENEYVNSDHVSYITYCEETNTTDCKLATDTIFEICEDNHVEDIIANIISGTKVMEVR